MDIQETLHAMQDTKYQAFQCKLLPTVDPETVIGIRTPALRKLAKTLAGSPEAEEFLRSLPHRYYDENNLHSFLLCSIRDFDTCIEALDRFLPYVDNWATCDQLNPAVLAKHPDQLLPHIRRYMSSTHTYTIRFGIELLMRYYLDELFRPEYLTMVAQIRSEEYYVNIMCAWYFATALAKQYEAALPYITNRQLPRWVHNKTIQKAVESYRVSPEQKAFLKTLKWQKEK